MGYGFQGQGQPESARSFATQRTLIQFRQHSDLGVPPRDAGGRSDRVDRGHGNRERAYPATPHLLGLVRNAAADEQHHGQRQRGRWCSAEQSLSPEAKRSPKSGCGRQGQRSPVSPHPTWARSGRRFGLSLGSRSSIWTLMLSPPSVCCGRAPWAFEGMRVVAAWCELRSDFRHFRVDRIASLRALDTRYPGSRFCLWRRHSATPRTCTRAARHLIAGRRERRRVDDVKRAQLRRSPNSSRGALRRPFLHSAATAEQSNRPTPRVHARAADMVV